MKDKKEDLNPLENRQDNPTSQTDFSRVDELFNINQTQADLSRVDELFSIKPIQENLENMAEQIQETISTEESINQETKKEPLQTQQTQQEPLQELKTQSPQEQFLSLEDPREKYPDIVFDENDKVMFVETIKDKAQAKELYQKGHLKAEQVLEFKALEQKKEGILYVDYESANILYSKGKITEKEYDEIIEYQNNPLWYYTKEIPTQAVGGMIEAVQEALRFGAYLFDALNPERLARNYANRDDETKQIKANDYKDKFNFNPIEKSNSKIGEATFKVSQFVTPFLGYLKIANASTKGLAMSQFGKSAISGAGAGAMTDIWHFSEHEKNLSNLIQEVPALQNPISEYLSNKGDESVLVGRFKNALDGVLAGAMIDGLLLSLKVIKTKYWESNGGEHLRANEEMAKNGLIKPISEVEQAVDEKALAKDLTKIVDDTNISIKNEQEVKISEITKQQAKEHKSSAKSVKQAQKELDNFVGEVVKSSGKSKAEILQHTKTLLEVTEHSLNKAVSVKELDTLLKAVQKGSNIDELANTTKITDIITDTSKFKAFIELSSGIKSQSKVSEVIAKFEALGHKAEDIQYFTKGLEASEKLVDSFVPMYSTLHYYTKTLAKESEDYLARVKAGVQVNEMEKLVLYDKIKLQSALQSFFDVAQSNTGRALSMNRMVIKNQIINSNLANKPVRTVNIVDDTALDTNLRASDMKDKVGATEVKELIETMGGDRVLNTFIEQFSSKYKQGGFKGANKLAKRTQQSDLSTIVYTNFLASILSGPQTQLMNLGGNVMNIGALALFNTAIQSGKSITSALKGHNLKSLAELNEITATYQGLGKGFVEAFRISKKNGNGVFWKSLYDNEAQMDKFTKIEANKSSNIPTYWSKRGREEVAKTLENYSPLKRYTYEATGRAMDILTSPLRLLTATDDALKAVIYNAYMYKSAHRKAFDDFISANTLKAQKGEKLLEIKDLNRMFKDNLDNPYHHWEKEAMNEARALTSTTPLKGVNYIPDTNPVRRRLANVGMVADVFGETVIKAKKLPIVGMPIGLIVPFITSPLGVVKEALRYTPAGFLSRKVQADLIAGGHRAEMVYAKMTAGAMSLGAIWYLWDKGLISIDVPKELKNSARDMNFLEYGIKIGDTVYQYNRLEPFGTFIGMVVSIFEAVKKGWLDDPEDEKLVVSLMATGILNNTVNKSYMQGIKNLVEIVTDPERGSAKKVALNIVSGMVPFSSFNKNVILEDDIEKLNKNISTAILNHIRDKGLPRLNIFGEEIKKPKTAGFMFKTQKVDEFDEVQLELFNVGANIGDGLEKITFNGMSVPLDVSQFNEFKKKIGATGVKEVLREAIKSESYKSLPKEHKAQYLKNIFFSYKEAAKTQFLLDNPRLFDKWQEKLNKKFNDIQKGVDKPLGSEFFNKLKGE